MDNVRLVISSSHWHALPVDIQAALRKFAVQDTVFQMSVQEHEEILNMIQGSTDHHVRRILQGRYEHTSD